MNDVLLTVAARDVEREVVAWLWPRRIPLGKLTMLEGHPGLGKSTVSLDLAARVSRDGRMPDGSVGLAGPVVTLTAEDGLGDTWRPRLEVAGADLARVFAVKAVITTEDELEDVEVPKHVAALAAEIEALGAVLVIVDPLNAFLSSAVNSWRDHDVRRALRPLAQLAEQCEAAVLCIRHLTKATGRSAITAGQGSIGIIAAARAGYLVAADPDDAKARLLLAVKNNLAPMPPTLRFRLETIGDVARVEWSGTAEHTADSVLAAEGGDAEERETTSECARWLQDLLTGDVEMSRRDVMAAGKSSGFSDRAVDRAARVVRVQKRRRGFGRACSSTWSLPTSASLSDIGGTDGTGGSGGSDSTHFRQSRHTSATSDSPAEYGENGGSGGEAGRSGPPQEFEPVDDGYFTSLIGDESGDAE
jgi:AAA domain